jgi:hypothetical protein
LAFEDRGRTADDARLRLRSSIFAFSVLLYLSLIVLNRLCSRPFRSKKFARARATANQFAVIRSIRVRIARANRLREQTYEKNFAMVNEDCRRAS